MKRKMLAVAALAVAPIWAGALEFTPQNTEVVIVPYAWRDQRVARFAAQEMTNFLSRAFGAKVPISDRIDPAKCSIVLGSNDWSVAAGIDTYIANGRKSVLAPLLSGKSVGTFFPASAL